MNPLANGTDEISDGRSGLVGVERVRGYPLPGAVRMIAGDVERAVFQQLAVAPAVRAPHFVFTHILPGVSAAAVITHVGDQPCTGLAAYGDVLMAEATDNCAFLEASSTLPALGLVAR
jgi:hypothetical protein